MDLGPGSIAFTGFNSDGADNISFAALTAIKAGTVIYFTDNEFVATTPKGSFNTGESFFSWTATTDIDPGTIITIDNINAGTLSTNQGKVAFLPGANRGLANSDEIVYAYLADPATPTVPTVFLTAVANNTLTSPTNTPATTLEGTGLIAGVNALQFGNNIDIAAYTGPRSGFASFDDYRAFLNNPANYATQDGTGDQSVDGVGPDVPFSTAALTVAAPQGQQVSFANTTVAMNEGDSGFTTFSFTVQRSGGTTGAVTFTGQLTGTGADAQDFSGIASLPFSFSGTIPAGASSATVTIKVAGDTVVEPDEGFSLTLQSALNDAGIATTLGAQITANGVIVNDDQAMAGLRIGDVQGTGLTSTYVNQVVTLTGVVTAVDTNGARGFYIQDPKGDGNAATSDAIFVFLPTGTLPIVGHSISVTGTVQEFLAKGADPGSLTTTELTGIKSITDLGVSSTPVTAIKIGGPGGLIPPTNDLAAATAFYESLEGELVTVVAPTATGPTNKFGEIFTVADHGAEATGYNGRGNLLVSGGQSDLGHSNAVGGDFNPERIKISVDSGILPGFKAPNVNVGAELSDVTGILRYDFGNFGVAATNPFTVTKPSTLVKETTALSGDSNHLLVASYNAENLDPSDGAARFATIAQQILKNLNTPDVVALQEVQDNTGAKDDGVTSADLTLKMLTDALNAAAPAGVTYAALDNPFIGNDTNGGEPGGNIRTAFIYRTDRVSMVPGSLRTLNADGTASSTTVLGQQTDPSNPFFGSRPPLVADFNFNGQIVTIVDSHFTSKGGSSTLLGTNQPPLSGGELQRAAQAQAVHDFVQGLLNKDPNAKVLVAGDLNEFQFEEPLSILQGTGKLTDYTVPGKDPFNATGTYTKGGVEILKDLESLLPESEQYDYVFEGNSETLDHILATGGLSKDAQFDVVHINAEFFDQTSDHDPLVARLAVGNDPTVYKSGDGLALSATGGTTTLIVSGSHNTLTGGAVADSLIDEGNFNTLTAGSAAANLLANGSNNILTGGAGNDSITAINGTGNTLSGGTGDDYLSVSGDQNTLTAGSGSDQVVVSGNRNRVNGGSGQATVVIQGDKNTVSGAAGALNITANGSTNVLFGGDGDDVIVAFGGINNTLSAGGGDNTLIVSGSNDALVAGTGSDLLIADNGKNTFVAGLGQTRIISGSSDDAVGSNTLQLAATVKEENLFLVQNGGDLLIDVLGTNHSVTVQGYFDHTGNSLSKIVTGDGVTLTAADVTQLVQAMAAFSSNHQGFDPTFAGQTTLPPDQALQAVIAVAHH